VTIARGETVVVPASIAEYTVVPQWGIELLCASVPQGDIAEPETELYGAVSAGAHTESR
jgi:hypothetical protein